VAIAGIDAGARAYEDVWNGKIKFQQLRLQKVLFGKFTILLYMSRKFGYGRNVYKGTLATYDWLIHSAVHLFLMIYMRLTI
jgi:hypothetical protein